MTYKEKLMKEHPKRVDARYIGGCKRCPIFYGYELQRPAFCNGTITCSESKCAYCWNREIPGTKEKEFNDYLKLAIKTAINSVYGLKEPESLYPNSVTAPIDVDLDSLVDKCIKAKERLIKEGKFNTSDSARLINTMLRMYERFSEVNENE